MSAWGGSLMGANQHDINFKELMSNPIFFEGFLTAYLPRELLLKLDWSSIKFYKMGGQHIESKTHQTFESDLIYLADFEKEKQMLWVHLEHQSRPDRRMPLRILNYQTAELLSYAKQNPKEKLLPGIISLIYHQGSSPWSYSVDLKDQFKDVDFYHKYFGKPLLIDLPSISDKELKDHQNIGPLEIILKQIKNKDFQSKIRDFMGDLGSVDDDSKIIILKYVISFLSLSEEKVMELVQESLPDSEELIMNAIDQWIQRGVERGMQQGRQVGIQEGISYGAESRNIEIARSMLMKGFDEKLIQEFTQLSHPKIRELKRSLNN